MSIVDDAKAAKELETFSSVVRSLSEPDFDKEAQIRIIRCILIFFDIKFDEVNITTSPW